MSLTPLVSVVMSTYNRADVVGRAIDSILIQTYDNFELVIVDDGSTDNTPSILKKYIAKDKRIVLLKQNNYGLAAARNTGVNKSQGKYIAFMDDDDISLPKRLEKQVIFLEKYPEYDACICGLQFVDLNGRPINDNMNQSYEGSYYPIEQEPYKNKQCIEWVLGPMTCITKKSFINCNGYRITDHLIIEDLDFTLRFLRKYKGAYYKGGEYLYLYTDPNENFGNNLSTKDYMTFVKRHIACYISAWFCRGNMADPVESDLKLDEIISLITKLPKSERYVIYESIKYMLPRIMKAKKISEEIAEQYISTITRVNQAAHPLGYFWLRLKNIGLL